MTLPTACPKPERREKKERKPLNKLSKKRAAKIDGKAYSTFAIKQPARYRCDQCGHEFRENKTGLCSMCGVGIDMGNLVIARRIKSKPRSKAETERIYGPPEFREWLHAQPCAICLANPTYTEQAHAKGDGMGRKASWRHSFPACGPHPLKDHAGIAEGCHRKIHRVGVQTFERAMGFTLESLAEETQRAFRAHVARGGERADA